MAEYMRADGDSFLAIDKKGDYTLTFDPVDQFIGDAIIPKRCRSSYASYFKIDRGDKVHLVGIGVITDTNGDYWVAKKFMGIEAYQFTEEFGDNIAVTRILVFEMSKALLSRWRHLSTHKKKEAKQAIIRDALHRLFKPRTPEDSDDEFEVMSDEQLAIVNTKPLEQVFDNLLADMFDDEDEANEINMDPLGKALEIC